MEPLIPPIASPHGGSSFASAPLEDEDLNRFCASVEVSLRPGALLRYALFELLMPITSGMLGGAAFMFALVAREFSRSSVSLALLFVSHLAVFFLPAALCLLLVRWCSQRRYAIRLASNGLTKTLGRRDVLFSWRKIVRVVEFKGTVWIASIVDACFIPREAFASLEEAREFAAMARELKQTRSAAWRDEWNGRTLGVQLDDDGARNNPA